MKAAQIWPLVKEAVTSWSRDRAPSMGAALAYYTVFSIAPLLLIVVSIVGLVFGEETASGEILEELRELLGEEGAVAVQGLLESTRERVRPGWAAAGTLAVLLIGATTVFAELQRALDRVWRAPEPAQGQGLWGLVRARLLSFGLILAFGFLLLVSLIASAALAALGRWWGPMLGGWQIVAQVLNFALSFGVITIAFAMIYKFMPRVPVQWGDVWVGAITTAALFTIGKTLIGLYIGKSAVASGFGAAASLVVLLVWVYYSAQIFLLGAEFTSVYAHTLGSLRGRPRPALQPEVTPQAPTRPG
ncbi:MAG TPA: YihY/virulence factor BrkB family protein [Burkholderiaceae bacterium]|nr:YihY/virulence factor BrkB family protein [Burkholderiaceae bacterium]